MPPEQIHNLLEACILLISIVGAIRSTQSKLLGDQTKSLTGIIHTKQLEVKAELLQEQQRVKDELTTGHQKLAQNLAVHEVEDRAAFSKVEEHLKRQDERFNRQDDVLQEIHDKLDRIEKKG